MKVNVCCLYRNCCLTKYHCISNVCPFNSCYCCVLLSKPIQKLSLRRTIRILRLNRCYTDSLHFDFKKDVNNFFPGERVSFCLCLSSTYIAKVEGVLPSGAFDVASALAHPSSIWIFLSSIFFGRNFYALSSG